MANRCVPRVTKPFYESTDLKMFQDTADQVLARLVRAEHYPLEPGVVEILRLRIASAVIQVADIGCRDAAKLEQLVMERFWGKEGSRSLPN
jgi:hypothetical protein